VHPSAILSLTVALALALPAMPAAAVSKSFQPTADNTLVQSATSLSNGAGSSFFVGRVASGSLRRGLVRFALADSIPSGSTVTAVTLRLRMTKTRVAAHPVALHRALAAWGEGSSVAGGGGGGGAAAAANDATWLHRFFPSSFWTASGGDFEPAASASIAVSGVGTYTWGSTSSLVADVQAWVDDPATNFGWILLGNELATSAKRFGSRESPIASDRPLLVVEFSTNTGVHPVPPTRELQLHAAIPNPFNPRTELGFTLPRAGHARIKVFDPRGVLITTLFDGTKSVGEHTVAWDGRDHRGVIVASGVYIVELQSDGVTSTRRVVLAK